MGNSSSNPQSVIAGYDMKGKYVIITGANTGIGKETARYIARAGGHVIMACRSLERAQKACDEIKQTDPTANLDILQVDLEDWNSIKNFVEVVKNQYPFINVLINNAGVVKSNYEKSSHGFEKMVTVNYFGNVLLTLLLLDMLQKVPSSDLKPRVVFVSSDAHSFAGQLQMNQLDFQDSLVGPFSTFTALEHYGRTKLLLLLFARALNTKLRQQKSSVLLFSVHPGWVNTELGREGEDGSMMWGIFTTIQNSMAKTPIEGAIPSVFCACAPELNDENLSGKYYSDINKEGVLQAYAQIDEQAEELYQTTEKVMQDWLGQKTE